MGTKQDFGTTVSPPTYAGGGGEGQERNRALQDAFQTGTVGDSPMGGKTPKAPYQPTPMETAQAQDWTNQQQYNRDQADKTAADTKAAADKLAAQGYTTQQINAMMTGGSNYLTQHLAGLGYTDNYGIADKFNELLGQAKQNVPDQATDVGKYFNYGDLFNTATAAAQTTQSGKLDSALRTLTPTGWENKYFADTADDPILQEILDQQKGDLEGTLKRKLDRGQMSQGAYDYALGQEGNLATGAMSTLQGIGGGVLSKYRGQLDDLASAFGNDVTNYKLGQTVDPTKWGTQLSDKATALGGTLKGDITSAVGNTQLFDPNALISKAGTYAGATNQPVAGGTPAGTGSVPLEDTDRTQGTSGIF